MKYEQPYGISDPNASYINGNPSTGTQGSIPPAASIEYPQREIIEVISRANSRAYADFTGTACAIPADTDLQQLRKAIEGFIRAAPPFNDLIDTAVTFHVHGTGADFTDINAAFEYLSKYKITHNGSVTLQLAGAASGSATQYVYTTPIICDHPNNDRIFIYGATMLGALPITESGLSVTGSSSGNRASDLTANLSTLRTKFATEINIAGTNITGVGTGIGGFTVKGKALGGLDAILLTSDGTGGVLNAVGFLFTCNGGYINKTTAHNNGLAAANFGAAGLQVDTRGCLGIYPANSNTASIICCGCGYMGVAIANGGEFTSGGPVIAIGNANYGVNVNPGGNAQFDGNLICSGNGQAGIYTNEGNLWASFGGTTVHIWKNGSYGLWAQMSPPSLIVGDWGSGGGNANGTFAVYAQNGSTVALTGSTNIGTCSPAINTGGNGNAYVVS